jgi:hypothetical protein
MVVVRFVLNGTSCTFSLSQNYVCIRCSMLITECLKMHIKYDVLAISHDYFK